MYDEKENSVVPIDDVKEWKIWAINEDREVLLRTEGEVKKIAEGDVKRIGNSEVYVEEVYYDEDVDSIAYIRIGEDVIKEFDSGDSFDELGEDYKDKYEFNIVLDEKNNDLLKALEVSYDVEVDEAEDENLLKLGGVLDFAGFAELKLELEDEYEYVKYKFSFDEVQDTNVLKVECDGDRCIEVDNEELEVAYLAADNSIFYRDDDNDWVHVTDTPLTLVNDEMLFDVAVNTNSTVISVAGFDLVADDSFEFLGTEEGETEQGDAFLDDEGIGEREEDILLSDGIIARNPENNFEDDEFVLEIPNEEVKAVLSLGR